MKPLHCKELFLSENFLLKMASVKLATVTSSIKGSHIYPTSPDIAEKLSVYWKKQTYIVTQQSRLLGTPMKQLDIYLMDYLRWLQKAIKKDIVLSVGAEVTGHPHDEAIGQWTSGDGIKVPCNYRFYDPKKSKAEFRNKLCK